MRLPDLKEVEGAILEVRREKEAAIEVQDFEKAASLRDRERKLLNQRRELEEMPRVYIGTFAGAATLVHERVHMRDRKRWWYLYDISYVILLPAIIDATCLLGNGVGIASP